MQQVLYKFHLYHLYVYELAPTELAHQLTRFILRSGKNPGMVYTPNFLHHIACGLMRHIRQSGKPQIDFFKGSQLEDFHAYKIVERPGQRSL